MGEVKIRISGHKTDLDALLRFICDTEPVKKFPRLLTVSKDYPNRDGSGCRRYLDVIIGSTEFLQETTLASTPLKIVDLEEMPMKQ